MTTTNNDRRKFLKATAIGAGVAMPLTAKANGADSIPSMVTLLLDKTSIDATAVVEGEGPFYGIGFDANSVELSEGSNTIATFYKLFRPDFSNDPERDLGFDMLTAQLTPAAEQEVTLTVSVVDGTTLSVDQTSQTVMSDASGLATFTKVKVPEGDFGSYDNRITEDHTFELRFSADDADDFVTQVTFHLGGFPESLRFRLEGEGTSGANSTPQSSTFFGEGPFTFDNFYQTYRPDFISSSSADPADRQLGLRAPAATLFPPAVVDVTLTAEMISGNDLDVEMASMTQVVTANSFGDVTFNKVFFTPLEFGPVGSSDQVIVTNHTVRLTYSAPGYADSVVELTLDLESGLP